MRKTSISRRDFLRAAALTAAGTTLAACAPAAQPAVEGKPTEAKANAPVASKEKITLTMWTHDNLYVQFFTNRAKDKEFQDKWPQYEITTNFQQLPEVFTKMLSSLSAGTEVPDLFGLEQGWFGNFTKNNLIADKFVDISNYIAAERSKFVENTWVKYTYQGKTYGVESALCTCGFYYQPKVLEKIGASALPKTWEEFMDLGLKAADQGVYLSALDSEGASIFDMLFMQRGGKYFDKDSNFVFGDKDNRDKAIEVMTFLKNGLDNKVFWPGNSKDFWGAGIMAAHKEGKVMGLPAADWWSDSLLKTNASDQSGNWHIGVMPKWKGGGHVSSVWGGTGFVVAKTSKYVDVAWDLIHYGYMTKENQLKRYEEIKYLPHMYEALDDARFTDAKDAYYGDQQVGKTWSEAAKDMPLYYQSPVRGDLNTELGKQMTNFYAGKTTAEAVMDSVVSVTKKAIEDL